MEYGLLIERFLLNLALWILGASLYISSGLAILEWSYKQLGDDIKKAGYGFWVFVVIWPITLMFVICWLMYYGGRNWASDTIVYYKYAWRDFKATIQIWWSYIQAVWLEGLRGPLSK